MKGNADGCRMGYSTPSSATAATGTIDQYELRTAVAVFSLCGWLYLGKDIAHHLLCEAEG